jgi:hypothetical protein
VALQSTFELEAVLSRVLTKIDQIIAERGTWPVLEEARRSLDLARAVTRQPAKLKALRDKLRSASETVGTEVPLDSALHEDIWDIEDYIDYRT